MVLVSPLHDMKGYGLNKMFLVIVLCINLFIFHSSVCQEYICVDGSFDNDDKIHLVETEGKFSSIYQKLNGEFIRKCHYNYYISPLNVNDTKFRNTQEQANNYRNLINLYVPDYYSYLYKYNIPQDDEIYGNIVYAGDINYTDPKEYVASKKRKPSNRNEKVKLVSSSAYKMNSGDLYDFVTSIQFVNGSITSRGSCYNVIENASQLKTILLCLDEAPDRNIVIDIKPLKLIISMDCNRTLKTHNNNFLAVLAPTLFKIDTDYNLVPVIFYETPYFYSLKDHVSFVNSVTLLPWQLLKYVYLEFLRSMDWQRVVILSDDSLYSIDFEYELTQLFNDERIVYTVVRCEGADCNMAEANRRLISVGATIVIGNVEQKNAEILLKVKKPNIIWLVRDLSMSALESINQRHVFSFTLASTRYKSQGCYYNDVILDGISRIRRAYGYLNSTDPELKKSKFYGNLAEQIRKEKPATDKIMGFVRRVSHPDDILQVLINKDGVKKVLKFNSPFKTKISDGVNCVTSSYNYFHPCEDVLILLFMFVIILFASTILTITCYFHKTSPFHDIRY